MRVVKILCMIVIYFFTLHGQNVTPKTEFKTLATNINFGQKSKLWPKIKLLVKNQNFGQKSKFW